MADCEGQEGHVQETENREGEVESKVETGAQQDENGAEKAAELVENSSSQLSSQYSFLSAIGVTLNLYPLDQYTLGSKEEQHEKDGTVGARLARMRAKYESEGLRRSVEGVILVHRHNHPHVLLLQIGNSFFKLPGGRLRPGESEVEGLKRKLAKKLAPASSPEPNEWDVGELVSMWWRPALDTHQQYPYIPAHITKPKECKKLFIVSLGSQRVFAIPRNLKLLAVPLFELYDNASRYGPVIASLPQALSRFHMNCIS